jgi:hypothetical protein
MKPHVVATSLAMEGLVPTSSSPYRESNPSDFADSNQGPATTCRQTGHWISGSRLRSEPAFCHGHVFFSILAAFSTAEHLQMRCDQNPPAVAFRLAE